MEVAKYNYENNESQTLFQAPQKAEITTSWVEVESLNGKDFTSSSGKIDIYIPPNIKYFDPSQSYLSFDLEVENSDGTALNLLRNGASCLFRSIRIYSAGNSAQLLEEIENYNTYTDVLYEYTLTQTGDRDKKSMTELVSTWDIKNDPFNENKYTQFQNHYSDGTTGSITEAKSSVKQRIQLPLHTGIFRNNKVWANALTGGIRVEIQLRKDKEVFKTTNANGDVSTLGSQYYPKASGTLSGTLTGTDPININMDKGKGLDASYGFACLPYSVGQKLKVYNQGNPTGSNDSLGSLTKIDFSGGKYRLFCSGGTLSNSYGDNGVIGVDSSTITGTYKISDLSMVVCEISPSSEWENSLVNLASSNQGYNYDVITPVNYLSSVNSGNSAIVSHIPVVNTRIKSILSVPVRVQSATYQNNNQVGVYDRYTDYQYFYLNQNQPSELVDLNRVANALPEQIHIDQVMKGIEGCEYPVNNLRSFKDCFLVARGVSYGKGTLNLESKDLMLKINTTTSGLQYNTLFNHFVVSLRRIRVANGELEVFY